MPPRRVPTTSNGTILYDKVTLSSSQSDIWAYMYYITFLVVVVLIVSLSYKYKFSVWPWPLLVVLSSVRRICCIICSDETNDLCKSHCDYETVEELVKAGNSFKLDKQWQKAGDSFEKLAYRFTKLSRKEHDAASNFAEAANCYRKLKQPEFIQKAVQCLKTASRIYAEVGQFSIAARQLEEAGDLLKSTEDYLKLNHAIEVYQQAADYFSNEDSPANAAGSRSKAAQLMADIDRFGDAAKEFEDLGVSSQQHSLLGFGASDYMFKACLCQMCLDPLKCAEMAEDLSRKCDSFTGSDEKALVMKLSDACNAGDAAAFDRALAEFERLNNLDDWSRRRLEPVRQKIAGEIPGLT